MMKTFRSISALGSLALALGVMAGPAAAQAQFDYQEIVYPGAQDTQVFGVNAKGNVVGNGIADPDTYPFVYAPKNGTFSDLAPLAGFANTSVLDINDRGIIVGSVVSLDRTALSGFIRDKDGGFTVFDHPDAVSNTSPRAVNIQGLVTGYRDSADSILPDNGFIYDPKTGTFIDIVPSLFTIAQGINAEGNVVGSAVFWPADDPCSTEPTGSPATVRYGWVRTTDGSVTYFSVNGLRTSARGINNSGTVAGFVQYPGTPMGKGFVTELDGTQCQMITIADEDLLTFPGAFFTIAHGVTPSGAVVGWYEDEFGLGGFIATPE
jgi:uncharacterized membrane protein